MFQYFSCLTIPSILFNVEDQIVMTEEVEETVVDTTVVGAVDMITMDGKSFQRDIKEYGRST